MKIIASSLAVALLVGCASPVVLSPGAQRVRQLQVGPAHCKFVGQETVQDTDGAYPDQCTARAYDKMRNRVAELGGNGYVILGESVDACLLGGTRIRFETYRCPD